ncbi:MAG: glycosyltransferase family 2 protein [Terracidiphilus sp.]
MQPERPLLTIAIPTYNRSAFLAQLLDVLAPQLASHRGGIELLISDNASPDETHALVERLRTKGLACNYVRNQTNIGADANFLQCFKLAQGQYVWIVGDDDIIPAGALDRLLHLLGSGNFDLVYLRPLEFRTQPMTEFQPDPRGRGAFRIQSAQEFCRLVGNMFTLTTCNIVNKQRVMELVPDLDGRLLETNLVHLSWTYPLLNNFRCGLYIFDRLISISAANRGGYSISRVFGKNFKQVTDQMLGSGSSLARIMHRDIVTNCLPFLVLEVRGQRFGQFNSENFHSELKPVYGQMGAYWFFLFPITSAPLWFAELWFRFIRRINSIRPALDLVAFHLKLRSQVK